MAAQQLKLQLPTSKIVNISLGLILLFLIVWVLIIGQTIILPFMIALFLSILLDPVVQFLTRFKIPLGISVSITLLLAFIFLYLLGLLVYSNVQTFVGQFPVYQDRLLNWIGQLNEQVSLLLGEPLQLKDLKIGDWLGTLQSFSIAKSVLSSVGTFVTFVLKMVIVIIFIAYLLTGRHNINDKIKRAFPEGQADRIIKIMENVTNQVQTYLGVKTIISFITGLISIIIFFAFGLDFAIFWGFLIFLFNFIPNIGSCNFQSSAVWITFSGFLVDPFDGYSSVCNGKYPRTQAYGQVTQSESFDGNPCIDFLGLYMGYCRYDPRGSHPWYDDHNI